MKLYLISNNLVLNDIVYLSDLDVEQKRINRPLSIEGEVLAKDISKKIKVEEIYSSHFASALASAKYLAQKLNLSININTKFGDSKIGDLGKHNIKMLRFMQEREFDFKFVGGESLNDTKARMKNSINKLIKDNTKDIAIFTHKRAILSYLLDYTDKGFNLDERLMLSINDKVILDDAETALDIIVIELDNGKIIGIDNLDFLG